MRLILHIGPTKTGTSFLQQNVFAGLDNIHFFTPMNKAPKGFNLDVLQILRRYFSEVDAFSAALHFPAAVKVLRRLAQKAQNDVLISNENLTTTEYRLFVSRGVKPKQFTRRVNALRPFIGFDQIDVVLAQRSADTLIASRYVQGAHRQTQFSQSDFESRVKTILQRGSEWGHYQWLKKGFAEETLKQGLGKDHVHLFDFDTFQNDERAEIIKLLGFVAPGQADYFDRAAAKDPALLRPRNHRRLNENTWQLARSEHSITLSKDNAQKLREEFGF